MDRGPPRCSRFRVPTARRRSPAARQRVPCSPARRAPGCGDLLGSVLYRAPESFAYSWTLNGATIPGATATTHTASAPGDYRCTVTASNPAGNSFQTSAAHAVSQLVTPPARADAAAPPQATARCTSAGLRPRTAALRDHELQDLPRHRIRAESLLTTVGNVTTYDDGTVSNGTQYYYRVSAVNSVGEGAQSNEVSAVPMPVDLDQRRHPRRGQLRPDRLHLHGSLTQLEHRRPSRWLRDAGRHGDHRRLRLRGARLEHAHLHSRPDLEDRDASRSTATRPSSRTRASRVKLSAPSGAIDRGRQRAPARSRTTTPSRRSRSTTSRHAEGNSGQTDFTFTVSLSNPSSQTVTVAHATQDGTATTADSRLHAPRRRRRSPSRPARPVEDRHGQGNGDTTFEPTRASP